MRHVRRDRQGALHVYEMVGWRRRLWHVPWHRTHGLSCVQGFWYGRAHPVGHQDRTWPRQAMIRLRVRRLFGCADGIRMHASLYLLYIRLVHLLSQIWEQEGSHGSPLVTYTVHVLSRSSVVIHLRLFGNLSTSLFSTRTWSCRRRSCRSCCFVHVSTPPRDPHLPSPSLLKGTKTSNGTRMDSGSNPSGLGSAEPTSTAS